MHLTNELMNQADWLNYFCTVIVIECSVWPPAYCVSLTFALCLLHAVLIIKNVLFLVPTGKVLELGFSKCFLIKAWLSVERLFPVEKILEIARNLGVHPEPHNFNVLAFPLFGYHIPQLKNVIAISAIAFSLHNSKL